MIEPRRLSLQEQDHMICPHCYMVNSHTGFEFWGTYSEQTCLECGEAFEVEIVAIPTFTTSKKVDPKQH